MPALLERPKLSNAMARALHKHIMRERERKRQGARGKVEGIEMHCGFTCFAVLIDNDILFSEEEEVDKMMEQKMKEEEERKRTKEIEERMSLEETKEQVWILNWKQSPASSPQLVSWSECWRPGDEDGWETPGAAGGEASAVFAAKESASRGGEEAQEGAEVIRRVGILNSTAEEHPEISCSFCVFAVTSQHWHQPVTLPACPCMLASTCSAFKVVCSQILSAHHFWWMLTAWASSFPLPGSPVSHSRPGALLGERSKQLFPAAVIPVSHVWRVKGTQLLHESNAWKIVGKIRNCCWMSETVPSGTPLPDPWLQFSLSRPRAVQRGPGGPRALRRGSGPAPLHLCPWTFCTR